MGTVTITPKQISELRQRTGAGMMDCKKALEEANGDMDLAAENLRKKGIAKADKRVDRAASEGKIVSLTSPDGRHGALLELNSETDFVSRNEEFQKLAETLAQHLMEDAATDAVVHKAEGTPFLAKPFKGAGASTIAEAVKQGSAKTGENVVLRRYARFKTDGALGTYVHHNGKVAVLVEVGGATGEPAQRLARTVAEHIAAGVPAVPLAVSRDQVPSDAVDRERRIFTEQAAASGKPENIVAKMVEGRVDKYFKEITLLEQPWVRDDSKTIADLLKEAGKEAGAELKIRRFARFKMGEE
jgi:elongation factor Ts